MYTPVLRRRTILITAGSLGLAGCLERDSGGDDADGFETGSGANASRPDDSNGGSALHGPLPGLVDADDREAYAESHGLGLREDGVVVVIELAADGNLPERLVVTVQSRYAGPVQAVVAVDDLPVLAAHGDVRAVRPPAGAHPP